MKSVLLLGGFLASSLLAAAGNLAQPQAVAARQAGPVRTLVYDIFGQPVERPAVPKVELADSITVVSRAEGCPWCLRLKPVIKRLQAAGYKVTVIAEADYKPGEGDPAVKGVPFLIYRHGDKVVGTSNYLPYDTIVKRMLKPEPPKLPPQPGDEPAPAPPAAPVEPTEQYDLGWVDPSPRSLSNFRL